MRRTERSELSAPATRPVKIKNHRCLRILSGGEEGCGSVRMKSWESISIVFRH
jgi:hypothetical protein